jgi:YwiC-like protein
MVMLPREHGAYSQMALPLVTSFVISGVTLAAVLTGLAVVLGFVAHEPLLVLLGRRGVRVAAEAAPRARKALALSSAAMIAVGVAALLLAPPAVRWSFLLPAIPAATVAAGLIARHEKSAPAELAVALAFSQSAVPICLAAGTSVATALSIGAAFAIVFVAGTLAVRVVILKVRAGGRPKAVRATRAALTAIAAGAVGAFVLAAARGALPWVPLLAVSPGLLSALLLAFRPKTPALKTVGWTLMSTSTAAAVILMAGL